MDTGEATQRTERVIVGNWKMHLDHVQAAQAVEKLGRLLEDEVVNAEVVVIAPFTSLDAIRHVLERDGYPIAYGAQDLSPHDSGAFTGDIAGPFLTALGCSAVLIGHSERRALHGETNEQVNAKVLAAFRNGLTPIVCVGEPLAVRQAGEHLSFAVAQLEAALIGLSPEQLASVIVAYEPVWAIGTGAVAGPEDAQEMCGALRAAIRLFAGEAAAVRARLLYGGSVKASNAGLLLNQPDVDGLLVGGASLDQEEFAHIIRMA